VWESGGGLGVYPSIVEVSGVTHVFYISFLTVVATLKAFAGNFVVVCIVAMIFILVREFMEITARSLTTVKHRNVQ